MKVWILVKGVSYEGGSVIGVYKNEEKAREDYNKMLPTLYSCQYLDIEEWEVCE